MNRSREHASGPSPPDAPPARPPLLGPERLTWLLVGLGIGLRLIHYAYNRSLWTDEAALAGQIVTRSFGEVLGPLDDPVQVAPFGFLIALKLLAEVLGSHELVLRLFPLLCGVLSMGLFPFLARRVLRPGAVPVAVALFAVSDPLVYYSSEVKQYSCDVLVGLLIYMAVVNAPRRPWPAWWGPLAVLTGLLAIFFSLSASLILAGVGIVWMGDALRERRWRALASFALLSMLWAAAFFAVYLPSFLNVPVESYPKTWPRDFFRPAPEFFLPGPLWSPAAGIWLGRAFLRIFSMTLGWKLAALPACVFLVGCVRFWGDRRRLLLLMLTPIAVNVIVSGFDLYPFGHRMLLYLAPALILLVAEGAWHILSLRSARVGPIFLALLVGLPLITSGFLRSESYGLLFVPQGREEMRSVVTHIKDRRLPGDAVYVYWFAPISFRYYWSRDGEGFDDCTFGAVTLGDPKLYLPELEKLRGKGRTWLVFSHVYGREPMTEETTYLGHLDLMGTRLDEHRVPGASAYLYDLRE